MAGLSQLLNPSWYSLSYDELSPDVRSLVDSGAFRWGESMTGGDDPKAYSGWQVADYSKIPTFADGTRFDNSNRDFNQHAGSWTAADSWDNIVDPSRVTNDPNFGRVTTTDNAYDNKGIGDFMEKVVIGTILGGAGLAGAGMAGFSVPSWVTGAAGAAEGGAAGWATGAGLDGIAGDVASSWLAPGGSLTGGAAGFDGLAGTALDDGIAAGGLLDGPAPLSAADAYAVASGGQTPTPFTSSAGGFSLTDAAKTVKQAASLLGGGGDVGAMPGGGAGGGLLGGGGGMGGGAGDSGYFMGLLRKYYGLA